MEGKDNNSKRVSPYLNIFTDKVCNNVIPECDRQNL